MSSVSRAYAQISNTRNYVVTDNDRGSSDLYTKADFDTWYRLNAEAVTKLGSAYLVNNSMDFVNVLTSSTGLKHATYNSGYDGFLEYYLNSLTLKDMGKEITIGTIEQPRLLVFRLVKCPPNSLSAYGDGPLGYAVLENNTNSLDDKFSVGIART